MAKTYFWDRFLPLWPKFGPQNIFSWILPPLDVRHSCRLSLYAISRKTNERNLTKWQKTQFWTRFWPIWPKLRPPKFFSDICLCQSLDTMVSYHHVQYSEKTNNPILRKLSDRRMDGQTDGRTDGRTGRPTDRRTRVISQDAVRLTSSIQNPALWV